MKDAQLKPAKVWAFMLSLCTNIYETCVCVCIRMCPHSLLCHWVPCLRSVIYAARQKRGIGPVKKRERDESEIHIWSAAKLQLPRDVPASVSAAPAFN